MSTDYKKITEEVIKLVVETGAFIKKESRKSRAGQVETKGVHNYVTYVDKESEARLVKGLSDILPEAGFIAEEGTSNKNGEKYNWVIDPLDGTTNFIHGAPPFAISVGLVEYDSKVVVGVVHEIMSDETFSAYKAGGAYLNGKKISVSKAEKITDSLIATGFPYTDFGHMERFMKTMQFFMKNSHGLRRLGSAATDLAYVACGRYDGFYEYGLNPWDVAAGICIVEEAGGQISDFSGQNDYIFGKEIIATNKLIHMEFVDSAGKMMKE